MTNSRLHPNSMPVHNAWGPRGWVGQNTCTGMRTGSHLGGYPVVVVLSRPPEQHTTHNLTCCLGIKDHPPPPTPGAGPPHIRAYIPPSDQPTTCQPRRPTPRTPGERTQTPLTSQGTARAPASAVREATSQDKTGPVPGTPSSANPSMRWVDWRIFT